MTYVPNKWITCPNRVVGFVVGLFWGGPIVELLQTFSGYEKNCNPQSNLKLFPPIHYVAIYKIIYVYYLNKSYDSLKISCDSLSII